MGIEWYRPEWLDEAVALPSFEVIDTRSAQGRLDRRPKTVTIADLVLFQGHLCDGLLRGAYAMKALADIAFPDAPLDRSNLQVVSKNRPCLGDVAAYLTGGRAQFGTHRLDVDLGVGFIVQIISSGEAWEVRESPGFFPAVLAGEAGSTSGQCAAEAATPEVSVTSAASASAPVGGLGCHGTTARWA